MNLEKVLHEEILPRVDKPSRYLGTEVNAVHKDPADVEVRLALAFPDLYDLGLGNLGVHILYAIVNRLPWAWCERVYAPAPDMEAALRSRGLPLFALESKDPVGDLDGLGFTLQTELTFTNILNLIDLAGIPLRTKDRTEAHPLTFAGGPAVFNPEPLAPFVDFFVIGDGEAAIVEIAEVLRKLKGRPRKAKLLALSLLEGVYVPALYPFDTLPDGRVLPRVGAPRIRKRVTPDLDGATFPVDYIVPYTQQVHDRVSLEVLRGCTQGCRFCQAGMTTRPVRERTIERIEDLLERTLDATGYEEVSLVSLSTCDYSRVREMVARTVEVTRPRHVATSLPSLRLDSFSVELADAVAETRRTGLTFAPEAASPRLRAVINKWIPDEELLGMSSQAFERGWDHVKLYFMIGLPTERDDDLLAIADLCARTLERGRAIRPGARVHLGVSTFVPKPFTPFQWARQIGPEETERRQAVLGEALAKGPKGIKFGRHEPEETFLEGLVSRADRRAADLVEAAWRHGARFDAWREHRNLAAWRRAIAETGYDVEDALRERALDERLPWDHLDVLVDPDWLRADWQRATELKHAEDCRHRKCHKCGVIDVERDLCASMLRDHVKGRKLEAAWAEERAGTTREVAAEPRAVQRLWMRIGRTGTARHLTHLEAMNAWLRALRRARAPLAWSQGFHPHPRVAFSAALPQAYETTGDYMDVTLVERVDPQALLEALRATLPDGFDVFAVSEVELNAPSLMSLVAGATYTVFLPGRDPVELARRVEALRGRETLLVERRTKAERKGRRRPRAPQSVDVRPMIRHIAIRPGELPAVDLTLVDVDGRAGKIREILPWLTDNPEAARVRRRDTLLAGARSMSADWDVA